ncbi:tRNA (adenosine(37)-N6)-dimethylallyltransferase MiaA [Agilicoccus flavus]|uniref:tRNA (adenosine(37)-N6)-dimethylallyltransferase MiaA n=1 Tax=Agilicoccus flavus TaxID=2775968 RepID=UPI001CF716B1|nr:tRNA (adenosine(37)-N6)-dimethylallyltransferase MiaA [Agilicoccus flavus]
MSDPDLRQAPEDVDPQTPVAPVVAVVGATATGKSAVAIEVAEALGGEVVGADASQLYRGMDIGTAKVRPQERRGIPHHQLDVLDIDQDASVAAYQRHARADLAGIRARGRVPILAGGSGLYVRAVLDRLEIPPTDPRVRARLEAELEASGAAPLRARLESLDPVAAGSIEPHNTRRIVRALEVVELTGRPFSATLPVREYVTPTLAFAIGVETGELDARIGARTRAMFDEGLVGEVEALAARGLADTRTASRSVGYRQVLDHLEGRLTLPEAIEATAQATRRLARRQVRWFGPDSRIRVLQADRAVGEIIAAHGRARPSLDPR